LDTAIVDARTSAPTGRRIRRRPRLSGLLNYYERAARRVGRPMRHYGRKSLRRSERVKRGRPR
jgi:hypothetical protein